MDQIPTIPQDDPQQRLAKLISIFGTVAPGTPLEQVLPRLGLLHGVHDTMQSLYTSAMGAMLTGLPEGSPEWKYRLDGINDTVLKWGQERGFNPLMPENIPHLEIAFAASVIQVVVEFIIAGGENYVQRMEQALRQIPAQYRIPGAPVDLEWFDPNTGEKQGSQAAPPTLEVVTEQRGDVAPLASAAPTAVILVEGAADEQSSTPAVES